MILKRSPVAALSPRVFSYVGAAALAAVVLWLLLYARWTRTSKGARRPRYPPGPRRLPFLGNMHQLPPHYQHVTFREWGKKYGASSPSPSPSRAAGVRA